MTILTKQIIVVMQHRQQQQQFTVSSKRTITKMVAYCFLVALICLLSSTTALECVTEWGGGATTTIPESKMNDNYCDCIHTGEDETKTNACAGIVNWSGITTDNDRYC